MGCLSSKPAADSIKKVDSVLNLTQHDEFIKSIKYNKATVSPNSLDLTQHSLHTPTSNINVTAIFTKDDHAPLPIDFSSEYVANVAVMSRKGYNSTNVTKKNQDSYFYIVDKPHDTLVIGVLDGHGEYGEIAANVIAKDIEEYLQVSNFYLTDLRKALLDTIQYAESHLLQAHRSQCGFSGTTLSLAAIRHSHLIVANVGDSRVMLCDGAGQAVQLSRDHKASEDDERTRIEGAGGRIMIRTYEDGYIGPARVYLTDANIPGLAMSRSLADSIVHSVGVSSEPEIFERELTFEDTHLIIATDGLWDFTSCPQVSELIKNDDSASSAIQVLMEQSLVKWKDFSPGVFDDTSIVVICLVGSAQ